MKNNINIAMIANDEYLIPALTTLFSIKENKSDNSIYRIYFITDERSNVNAVKILESDCFQVNIVRIDTSKYKKFDIVKSEIRSATSISLAKFELWDVLKICDRCLYLDCDLIVKKDLTKLFNTDLKGFPIAAIVDSGSIYYKHKYVKKCDHYFNSGVMLIDMALMREEKATDKLIKCKKELTDSLLMDQDAFNVVFDKNFLELPIKYNFLYVNMIRSTGNWTIDQLNAVYKTSYKSLNQVCDEAVILHFASKDKPWKNQDKQIFKIWKKYYNALVNCYPDLRLVAKDNKIIHRINDPLVSVIIPVFNTGKWLCRALDSVIYQTYKNIEIIAVDDGSNDDSVSILREYQQKDKRIQVFVQKNSGQSTARNRGLLYSKGEFVYFFDSDDYIKPETIEKLVTVSNEGNLDLVIFGGAESYYENKDLENKYPHYKTFYKKHETYESVYSGEEVYPVLVRNRDYNVSPCLQFIRRSLIEDNSIYFYENIIYEDNLFSIEILMNAKRVKVLSEELFVRTVRSESTMTSIRTDYSYISHQKLIIALIQFLSNCNNCSPDARSALYSQISYFIKSTINKYDINQTKSIQNVKFNTPFESVILMLLSMIETSDGRGLINIKRGFWDELVALLFRKNENKAQIQISKGTQIVQKEKNIKLLKNIKVKSICEIKLHSPNSDNHYHKRIPLEKTWNRILLNLRGVEVSDKTENLSIGLIDVKKNKIFQLLNATPSKEMMFCIDINDVDKSQYALAVYAGGYGKTGGKYLNVERLEINYFL